VIKNLNDSCIILTEPILETLKSKLKQYIKHYKNKDEYDKEAVDDIYKELK
jgi:hypothetical protein